MRYRRTVSASVIALLLTTCTSCQIEELDQDGDGQVSKTEFLSAAFDFVCGNQAEPEMPDDETSEDESENEEDSETEL